ncbi:sulfatase [Verrucomicrobiaceae bacterium 227]
MKTLLAFLLTICPLAAAKPNVLFLSIDDLNDWVGCLGGHPRAVTPNIDALAARGILFTNAHCASPACNPSRAAIFTGQMPDKTGVWNNKSGSIYKNKPDAVHLPTTFAKGGYHTLGTGKLLHNQSEKNFQTYFPVEQRWSPFTKKDVQYTRAELPSKGSANPLKTVTRKGQSYHIPLNQIPSDRNPTTKDGESFDWGTFDIPASDYGDTKVTNWAIQQLQSHHAKPTFLGIGYYRPHIPLWAPKSYFERFKNKPATLPPVKKDDLNDLSPTGKKWALEADTAGLHSTVVKHQQWTRAVEAYLACTTYVDHEIGRLIQALDQSSQAENTLIVLWSDHGWHLGEKEHWGKWTGWERSTKVPLIIVPPKNAASTFAKAGSRCHQPVSLLDLYPTLVDLCHLQGPDELDGTSLLPLLRKPDSKTNRKVITVFDQGNTSIRSRRWRYLHYHDGSEELYDLINDPNEWTNLARDQKWQTVKADLATHLPPKK